MIVIVGVFIWRIVLFILSYFTIVKFPFTPKFPYSDIYLIPSHVPEWMWRWANFDGVHYLTIAHRGYFAQFTQAFFPLYPLLTGILGNAVGDKELIATGLSLSFLCLVPAILLYKKLLLFDYPTRTVTWMLLFLLVFPTSFYFAAFYTESLFFLLVICAFYCSRRKWWLLAGLAGFLATLTRLTGIFLLPALLWEWNEQKYQISKKNWKRVMYTLLVKSVSSPILYIIPLGLIAYMVFLQQKFGDALYFWHAQEAFGAQRQVGIILPPQVVWRYLKIIATVSSQSSKFWIAGLELFSYLITIVCLYVGHLKKIRTSYLIFSWFVVLVPAFTGTFTSLPRYVLLAFPLTMVLALIPKLSIRVLLLGISLFLMFLFASWFLRGLWIA